MRVRCLAVCLSALPLLAGCGLQAVVTAPTASDSPVVPAPGTSMPAQQLPDGIPLPSGALLVSGPTDTKARGQVTGWAAIATQSADVAASQTLAFFRTQLTVTGWALSEPPLNGVGRTVSAQREVVLGGEQVEQWLQVSVTEPLTGSGAAITYRFVASPVSAASVTPTPASTRTPAATPSASAPSGGRR